MVERFNNAAASGLWVLALTLAACPGSQTPDSGPISDGGQGPGLCSDAGTCPGGQYCQSLITGCSGEGAVAVASSDPGNCYFDHPCPLDAGFPDCTGAACNSDFDCGLSATEANTGLTCLEGVCCLDENCGENFGGGGSSSSSSGGPVQPICPDLPVPCPQGCTNFVPIYGCPVCLCTQCPIVEDAGVEDAGTEDAGLDAGPGDAGLVDAGLDAGPADGGSPDGGVIDGGLVDGGAIDDGGTDGGSR